MKGSTALSHGVLPKPHPRWWINPNLQQLFFVGWPSKTVGSKDHEGQWLAWQQAWDGSNRGWRWVQQEPLLPLCQRVVTFRLWWGLSIGHPWLMAAMQPWREEFTKVWHTKFCGYELEDIRWSGNEVCEVSVRRTVAWLEWTTPMPPNHPQRKSGLEINATFHPPAPKSPKEIRPY